MRRDAPREYRLWGPPGTGKTTELATRRIPRALERFGSPWAVVACSFSKAAASELRTRAGLPEEHVGTLHSLCYRAIGKREILDVSPKLRSAWNELHPSWPLSGASEDDPDDYLGALGSSAYPGDALLARCDLARQRMDEKSLTPAEGAFLGELREFLDENHALDFTGMVEWGMTQPFPLPRAQALVVDEAQDLSALEMAVVRNWARDVDHLLLAGDPNQSIYGFRGATPEAFDAPDVAVAEEWTLGQSYRLPRAVRAYAEEILLRGSRRQFDYKSRDEEGEVHSVSGALSSLSSGQLVKTHAERSGTTMYLASCRYQLSGIVNALRAAGVPFHNPYRPKNGAWNPLRGGVERVKEFLSARTNGWWSFKSLWRWSEHLDAEKVFVRGTKTTIKEAAARGAEGLTSLELRPFFTPAAWGDITRLLSAVDPIPAAQWMISHVLPRHAPKYEYVSDILRWHGIDKLFETPRVIVGTIHSVKGGEADHVVMTKELSPRAYRALQAGDNEPLRVLYVGATRAKQTLSVFGG